MSLSMIIDDIIVVLLINLETKEKTKYDNNLFPKIE